MRGRQKPCTPGQSVREHIQRAELAEIQAAWLRRIAEAPEPNLPGALAWALARRASVGGWPKKLDTATKLALAQALYNAKRHAIAEVC